MNTYLHRKHLLTKVILEKSDLDFQPQINSDSDTDEATPPKRGRPSESSKSFLDLKNDRMRKRSQDIYDKLLIFCETENIPLDRFLAYIGRRYYLSPGVHHDHEKGKVFNELLVVKNLLIVIL